MGKRSDFPRRAHDAYDTPPEAVKPLLPHLRPYSAFWEPCAGNGQLARELEAAEHWAEWLTDIEPRSPRVEPRDALDVTAHFLPPFDYIITNPPWTRSILHPMIEHFSAMRPTWLLFDADWMHTKQAAPYLPFCHKIVGVGRVKWIPDSKHTGKDNCAWYLFDANKKSDGPVFYGRAA